jgi:hypothetical protein
MPVQGWIQGWARAMTNAKSTLGQNQACYHLERTQRIGVHVSWAVSSAVERSPYTRLVGGSNPSLPTKMLQHLHIA